MGSIAGHPFRRLAVCTAAAGMQLLLFAGAAHADLVISTAATRNVHCDGGKCHAKAADAVLNIDQLKTLLGAGNVRVSTAQSAGPNIVVNAALSWANAHSLTLDAYTSVAVNAPITVAGTGGLSLITNDGGYNGTLFVADSASITFWGTGNKVAINGIPYKLVNSIASLAAAVKSNPKGFFALSRSYDATADGIYAAAPVGFFQGYFEGFGNTIANLSISDRKGGDFVGLFKSTDIGSLVQDVKLTNVNVVARKPGTVGGLVGWSFGSLLNDTVTGKVRAPGNSSVGLLVGSAGAGMIANSHSSGSVTGRVAGGLAGWVDQAIGAGAVSILNSSSSASAASPTKETYTKDQYPQVGGLAGFFDGYLIENSWASGKVTAGSFALAGGLVGDFFCGVAIGSFSTGDVSAGDNALTGGLVGDSVGDITCGGGGIGGSYATGAVHGGASSYDGGLAGECGGGLLNDFASGVVTGGPGGYVGGLVGYAVCAMDQVSASGSVAGGSKAGGLVGLNVVFTSNAYATGSVTGEASGDVGGLIGHNAAPVNDSYSTGAVTENGAQYLGGLIGENQYSPLSQTYWDMTTSGITNAAQGTGNVSNAKGITGRTNRQLQSRLPNGFDSAIWGQSQNINNGLPYLRGNSFVASQRIFTFRCPSAMAAKFANLCRHSKRR